MNPNIELIKKYLADNDSVTPEELKENRASADAATNVSFAAAEAAAEAAAAIEAAADVAADATYAAAEAAAYADVSTHYTSNHDRNEALSSAAHWVKEYEQLTK